MTDLPELSASARELAESLQQDIILCKTREEHIRVTARANAAAALSQQLNIFLEAASRGEV